MHKILNLKIFFGVLPFVAILGLIIFSSSAYYIQKISMENSVTVLPQPDLKINLLFTGDIFLDRHIDTLTQKDNLKIDKLNKKSSSSLLEKYSYPFSGLSTLNKEYYDAWIGNLECPVTNAQSTKKDKNVYLRFSCRPEYLPQLKKYFEVVSLSNNHTNNMGERIGLEETKKHLDGTGIKYFGDFDNSQIENICNIYFINVKSNNSKIPIALCGYHGVFKLPTDKEISVLKNYSKYFITFVMPHQGEEYKFKSNKYQQQTYRKMIDSGADAVFGSHPHVIQEAEQYKGKLIFYSLGNFIFDQSAAMTRQHMQVQTEINLLRYQDNYKKLVGLCEAVNGPECLRKAEIFKIVKPNFTLKYRPQFTNSGLDFITKLQNLNDIQYQKKLNDIGFNKVASSSKI
jgi:poly-gamma-glutamate synthesis protein (capsule biosynthesis protein)